MSAIGLEVPRPLGRRLSELLSRRPLANALVFTGCWGLQTLVAKVAYREGASVGVLAVVSVTITLIVLDAYAVLRHRAELRALRGRLLSRVLAANALHAGLGNLIALAGIALTSAVNAGFLMQCQAATTVVAARLALGERVTAAKTLSLVGLIGGAFLLTTGGRPQAPRLGDVLILTACGCWAAATVMLRPMLERRQVSAGVATALRPVAGLPVMLAAVAIAGALPAPVHAALTFGHPTPTAFRLAMVLLGESVAALPAVGAGLIVGSGVVTELLARRGDSPITDRMDPTTAAGEA
ncbi:MAG TPA: DMT family transporter [Candidatus Dormibacteraeota bacterium]|nr:DMT family transporter [Candidatus Dormibacteraeota bacterium]